MTKEVARKGRSATEIKAEYEADQARIKADAKAKKDAAAAAKKQADAETKVKKDAEKAEAKVKTDAEKAAKKEASDAAKAEAKATREASKQPTKNDVTRPKPETACGRVWQILDDISARNAAPASISEALPVAAAAKINPATTRTQYARWRAYHGVTGRVAAPKPVEPVTPPAAETAPATEGQPSA